MRLDSDQGKADGARSVPAVDQKTDSDLFKNDMALENQ